MAALEIARVDPSSTRVLPPVPSARTYPVTATSPGGGGGISSGRAPALAVRSQPRSTSRAVPSPVTSGTTTSTPATPSRVRYRTTTVSCGT